MGSHNLAAWRFAGYGGPYTPSSLLFPLPMGSGTDWPGVSELQGYLLQRRWGVHQAAQRPVWSQDGHLGP